MDEEGDGGTNLRGLDGGIAILDAKLDVSLGFCASRSRLGIHMVFDFSCFCGSWVCTACIRDLGTNIYFDFDLFCSVGLCGLLDISFSL